MTRYRITAKETVYYTKEILAINENKAKEKFEDMFENDALLPTDTDEYEIVKVTELNYWI